MDDGLGPLASGQSRAALVAEVGRALETLPLGTDVVIAFSGGPDSTALAYLVAEARPDLALQLVHIRHGLRDDREDVEVVRLHGDWLDLPLNEIDVEVTPEGQGWEAAARAARYAALRSAASEMGGAVILLGHTAEDQAETVLLRLARGTGLDGLVAMSPRRDDLVRPLLRIRRVDVHRFVELEGLPHAEDPTNRSPEFRRNTVRHHVLPGLAEVADDPVGALVRLTDLARADVAALDVAAEPILAEVRRVGVVASIPLERLQVQSPAEVALARRVVRQVLTELVGEPPDAQTVQRVLTLGPGSAASLPGPVEVASAGGWCTFAPRTLPRNEPITLDGVGRYVWEPAAAMIELIDQGSGSRPDTAKASRGAGHHPDEELGQVAFDLPGIWAPPPPDEDPPLRPPGAQAARLALTVADDVGELVVRHREPGDRVVTAAGTQRLQDLLVDAGMPRVVRELWPIVTRADGEVVWVPGYAANESVLRAGRRAPSAQLRLTASPP